MLVNKNLRVDDECCAAYWFLMTTYTIGQLANAAGVPISTVRYYERQGLLKADFRTGANYRHYSDVGLRRLRFIRASQATGFSLGDIRQLLSLAYSDEAPCEDVLSLAAKRLEDIRSQIRELQEVERVLVKAISDCCMGPDDICSSVGQLRGENGPICGPNKKSAKSS
jgi:MerR family copper efflux transcriptional regulator